MNNTRAALRDEMTRRVQQLEYQLARRGFTQYRQSEMLHPETRRHVRVGYASDEWTIIISDFAEIGYGGVAQRRADEVGRIRLDARQFERGTDMPVVDELVALVLQ